MKKKRQKKIITSALLALTTSSVMLAGCLPANNSGEGSVKKEATPKTETNMEAPPLDVTLIPHSKGDVTEYLEIEMDLPEPKLKDGEKLVEIPIMVTSIPSQQYSEEDIVASDDDGELPLDVVEGENPMFGATNQFVPERPTKGDVHLSYRADPRKVDANTKGGPYFDLRQEADGLNGAGNTFLALPDDSKNYTINLEWDLDKMPSGATGVWSYGEGDVTKVGPPSLLANTYFATGNLKKYEASDSSNFAMYWLGKPDVDTEAIGEKVGTLFDTMSSTFKDGDEPYKVFVRENPYDSTGGTALLRSFMFGYSSQVPPTADSLQKLLAHEIVHNWADISADLADKNVYSEGAAEYFSLFESYKAGVMSEEELMNKLNEMLFSYYTNPYISESNQWISENSWTHHAAQRIAYGRGVVYFLKLDDQLKSASEGKTGVEDLAVELIERKNKGEAYGFNELFTYVNNITDGDAEADFKKLASGELVTPPENLFENYKLVKTTKKQFEVGFDDTIFNEDKKIVKGLIKGSNAEKAGLKNGDEIISFSDRNDIMDDENLEFKLKVKRDNKELDISYLPRGKEVPVYVFGKN
ncbi:hypothetical protein [Niallia taxi]|uniref:hypothetical protein n=1 Tax=Niallia taxi TaxID=2499688 RepID=UPI002E1E80B2|nr:hypothetical protein [Niallia taxi]